MSYFQALSSSTELISAVIGAYLFVHPVWGLRKKIKQPQRQVVCGLMCPLVHLSIITPRVHNTSQNLVICLHCCLSAEFNLSQQVSTGLHTGFIFHLQTLQVGSVKLLKKVRCCRQMLKCFWIKSAIIYFSFQEI